MKRRQFITLLGGAAAAWPLSARAQQPAKLPTIGFLGATTPATWSRTVGAAVLAAKQATSLIPIVFAVAADPVGGGLVASLARPGGNVTGLSTQFTDLAGKRLELSREMVPSLRRLAIMANARYPAAVLEMAEVQ